MERQISALSLFLLAFLAPGILAGSCNMTGFWRNELGSVFYLTEAKDFILNGRYLTAVEAAKEEAGPERQAQVTGIRNNGKEPTFSMSTAWAGELDKTLSAEPQQPSCQGTTINLSIFSVTQHTITGSLLLPGILNKVE
ncbi:avidin-related protein 1-like isoform X2 [Heterodontus francisci]|uniref:avidin-related protein 1-like isoform X2 n=1 Tax=Heterodontus francisci TaxID=7792 RepID=UPI00355B4DDB